MIEWVCGDPVAATWLVGFALKGGSQAVADTKVVTTSTFNPSLKVIANSDVTEGDKAQTDILQLISTDSSQLQPIVRSAPKRATATEEPEGGIDKELIALGALATVVAFAKS